MPSPNAPTPVVNDTPITVATVGNATTRVTCAMIAAVELFPNANILGTSNYEEAAFAVKYEKADYFVAPCYHEIKSLIAREEMMVEVYKTVTLPALVVVAEENGGAEFEKLFYYPPAHKYLKFINSISYGAVVPVGDSETAVKEMMKAPDRFAALTNTMVAALYGLVAIQQVRGERQMDCMGVKYKALAA